jgi:hypothetical protein
MEHTENTPAAFDAAPDQDNDVPNMFADLELNQAFCDTMAHLICELRGEWRNEIRDEIKAERDSHDRALAERDAKIARLEGQIDTLLSFIGQRAAARSASEDNNAARLEQLMWGNGRRVVDLRLWLPRSRNSPPLPPSVISCAAISPTCAGNATMQSIAYASFAMLAAPLKRHRLSLHRSTASVPSERRPSSAISANRCNDKAEVARHSSHRLDVLLGQDQPHLRIQ